MLVSQPTTSQALEVKELGAASPEPILPPTEPKSGGKKAVANGDPLPKVGVSLPKLGRSAFEALQPHPTVVAKILAIKASSDEPLQKAVLPPPSRRQTSWWQSCSCKLCRSRCVQTTKAADEVIGPHN